MCGVMGESGMKKWVLGLLLLVYRGGGENEVFSGERVVLGVIEGSGSRVELREGKGLVGVMCNVSFSVSFM